MDIKKDIIDNNDYRFLKANPLLGDNVILLSLGGSYAYGTNVETSDIDVRGIALNPMMQILGLQNDFKQIVDNKTDTVIYSLKKMVKLLLSCNPNAIEILGCRPEDYIKITEIGQVILDNRHNFLSVQAIRSFGGYADSQYNRLEHGLLGNGENDDKKVKMLQDALRRSIESFNTMHKSNRIDLELNIVSRSSLSDMDSFYQPGEMFTDQNMVVISGKFDKYPVDLLKEVTSSIHTIQTTYGNINKRNTMKTDIKLSKHMMHLIRLYMMAIDIVTEKKIKTYRDGAEHELLMDIRNKKYMSSDGLRALPEFYEILHDFQNRFEYALQYSVLDEYPNYEALQEMMYIIYKKQFEYGIT